MQERIDGGLKCWRSREKNQRRQKNSLHKWRKIRQLREKNKLVFMRVVNEFARRYCLLQCLKCVFEISQNLSKFAVFFPFEWKILESPAKFLDRTHFNIRCHPTQYCKSSYFPFRLSLTLHICTPWTLKKNLFLFFTCWFHNNFTSSFHCYPQYHKLLQS
jgi:hypothetical protein